MSYQLNEEQEMLRQIVSRMVEDKVAPRASEIDEKDEYPWDLKEIIAEQGLLGSGIPEEYGGTGAGLPSVCLIVEEIAKASASVSLIVAAQELGMMPILVGGSEEQKQKYLPGIADGDQIAAFALTEPNAGSDAGAVKTKAVREGDKYLLSGQKCFITNGSIADVFTVFATIDPKAGLKGLSAFIVEKGYPGLTVSKKEHKMGIRGSETTEIILDNCPVPAENLMGKEGGGFKIAMMTLDCTRPVIGAQAVGIAQGALDHAINYAKQRIQFNKPIAAFQGIQFMLADMATRIEAARQLVYKAAFTIENAKQNNVSAAEVSRLSSMCKLFASDVAMQVTVDAVQILGGYGYMKEYPVERMMRDAKITQIYEGTNQIQRVVIAKNILDN
ncbi:MAG TPA: acyl-CoA dehydrogenase [Desulfotomaculum sp.]|nr:acyl-CoA dehydrogenase [Desulfotomaculum sp.]